MSRPITLTQEEKDLKKKEKSALLVCIRMQTIEQKTKLEKFAEQYQSLNFCILDLIKTHPDFKKFKVPAS